MNDLLNAEYKVEEVKTALIQMFQTNASGSVPALFYQHHWDVCGKEVTKVVLRIISGTESAACIN